MAEGTGTERIVHRVIEQEMKQAYVDVRDGLKPVHRRILYAMHDSGLLHNKPFKKSAHIVGKVLAETHPHGDIAVYDALARMAQDFSLRYPLIDGQGNWGSIDGDNPAAMRYTEARLKKLAEELLQDLDKGTVLFVPNYDSSLKEPSVLPSKVPNLLINGSSGIAVGMTTNIPPHNLREVCAAMLMLIENPAADINQLMAVLPGPDFPTGAIIAGSSGIEQAYKTGHGKVTVKAVANTEEGRIIVTEIPYMLNKSQMIEEMADLVREKKIDGIRNIRDESDSDGIRVVIELKSGVDSTVVLNQLYKYSRMRTTFGIIFLALVDNEPRLLTLKALLQHFIDHRRDVIRKRTQFELAKAEERAHILAGLLVALDHIDTVVAGIRASKAVEDAQRFLRETYQLTEVQAKAVLEMRLQKLASLEQQAIRTEHGQLLTQIEGLRAILASEQKIFDIIRQETIALADEFGDARRTRLLPSEEAVDVEELIEDKDMVVTMSRAGYIKRIGLDAYRQQRRGGKGITAATSKDEDWIESLFVARSHSHILFFTNLGQVHWLKVFEIPEAGRTARGRPVVNLLSLAEGEKITACVPIRTFDAAASIFFATGRGVVKKTPLAAFSRPRRGGIRAMTLAPGDELIGAQLTDGTRQIILATRNGLAIRFREGDVRAMGRAAGGVRGITLGQDDRVVSMEIADEQKTLLTATTRGYGKRTPLAEYRLINRGGKGVTNIALTEKTGKVAGVKAVTGDSELMFLSKQGAAIRIPSKGISLIGRATQGVRIMKLEEGDELIAVERLVQNGA